jgi:hypothetical protein
LIAVLPVPHKGVLDLHGERHADKSTALENRFRLLPRCQATTAAHVTNQWMR